jgi:uncharacterized protein
VQNIRFTEVFAVQIDDRYLVYSPLHAICALVNKKALGEIKKYLEGRNNADKFSAGPLKDTITSLSEKTNIGHIYNKTFDPVFLGIVPSRRCNMSCIYCSFGADKNIPEKLNPATAVAAVDYMAEFTAKAGKKSYDIQFFGGEPLIEDEIIYTVVHHARFIASKTGISARFEVSTNGALSEAMTVFAGDYLDTVVISLDGFKKHHDITRPMSKGKSSFDMVARTARYLSSAPAELCLRCCITDSNVEEMESIASWFCEEFEPSIINFETLQENELSLKAGIKPPDPYIFASNYLRAAMLIEDNNVSTVYAPVSLHNIRNSFCPVGKDAVILLPDSSIASCYLLPEEWEERGMDLRIGNIDKYGKVNIDYESVKRIRDLVRNKPRCNNCLCKYSCAGGCHVNNTYPGCTDIYNDFCKHTRIIMVCKLLNEAGLHELADRIIDDNAIMKAIALQPSDKLTEIVL